MKQAIFLVIDNGIEGKSHDSIMFASKIEFLRDSWLERNPNKNWYRKKDIVEDLDALKKKSIKKLDGLDRLALDL